jgi:hypothetical protein
VVHFQEKTVLSGDRVEHERLEVRDQPLGLRHQPAVLDQSRANARLHVLDQRGVLDADLRGKIRPCG